MRKCDVRTRNVNRRERTNFSSPSLHVLPSSSVLRRLRWKAKFFNCSYAMNCTAPELTPKSAIDVPLYRPRMPSFRTMDVKPSACSGGISIYYNAGGYHPIRMRPLYAVGASGLVVNIRTFTTHIGFVNNAVIAPKER